MNDEPQIPLLQDLLYRGQTEDEQTEISHSTDENTDFEIEQDEQESEPSDNQQIQPEEAVEPDEELPDEITSASQESDHKDVNHQDLMLEKEIRQILDKQMDKAYKKIIRLINEKKF